MTVLAVQASNCARMHFIICRSELSMKEGKSLIVNFIQRSFRSFTNSGDICGLATQRTIALISNGCHWQTTISNDGAVYSHWRGLRWNRQRQISDADKKGDLIFVGIGTSMALLFVGLKASHVVRVYERSPVPYLWNKERATNSKKHSTVAGKIM